MNEFNKILENINLKSIREPEFLDRITETNIRSFTWSLLLGCFGEKINRGNFLQILQETRTRYEILREKYVENKVIPLFENNSEFPNKVDMNELHRILVLDVKRTDPQSELFAKKNIQEMMKNVLLIYVYENQRNDGYKQGMHEILIPVIYILQKDLEYSRIEREKYQLFLLFL
eukprot:Anaeramoba_ignava/c8503_g1_i1.p1 GENE.c8503_g1_i1~~c8503_g1_i1.p1  ORF type:complete len:200 (-),score=50.36 c8503_g1_i1:725-1246(-)